LILYQVEQGIARITLNRPEKRNALNPELIAELKKAVERSDRLIVLTGAGNDFCSGADLSGLHEAANADVLEHLTSARALADLFIAMRRYPHPIIAAVRGRALAGGCGLATATDIILAAESAHFGYPEVNVGFVPAMVMAILRRCASEKRAFELITTGDVINAQTAFDFGLVNRVFADETFDVDVEAFASRLASKSASALMLSKQLLYHTDAMSFEAAIEAGVQTNAIARSTEDCKLGIERFLKKKPSA
jgi:methylglutaconyl-CoA hydratase